MTLQRGVEVLKRLARRNLPIHDQLHVVWVVKGTCSCSSTSMMFN